MSDYAIHLEPLYAALDKIDVDALVAGVDEDWYNQTLIAVGDVLVRLGVLHGEFHWHKHDEQDEFFFVIDGNFSIELEDEPPVELGVHQGFTVPAGMMHRPVVPGRVVVLMIEKAGIAPTGD